MRARSYEACLPRREHGSVDGEDTSLFLHPTRSALHNAHFNVVHPVTALPTKTNQSLAPSPVCQVLIVMFVEDQVANELRSIRTSA